MASAPAKARSEVRRDTAEVEGSVMARSPGFGLFAPPLPPISYGFAANLRTRRRGLESAGVSR
jgi:hypothetical protein